jgi:hypothetical protein
VHGSLGGAVERNARLTQCDLLEGPDCLGRIIPHEMHVFEWSSIQCLTDGREENE